MARKKGKKIKGQKLDGRTLRGELLRYLRQNPGKPLSARQLIKRLKIGNDKNAVSKALKQLVKDRKVMQHGDAYYPAGKPLRNVKQPTEHQGVVDMARSGDAYIGFGGASRF